MTDPREAFEAWFTSVYGPPPSDAQIMASLAEAARLEAFMGGAWAAWQHWAADAAIYDVARLVIDDAKIGELYPASASAALRIVLGARDDEQIDDAAARILAAGAPP